MADLRMVVLGDSVTWGQGLRDPKKFHVRVYQKLTDGDSTEGITQLAHSGATIGVGVTTIRPPVAGEVPVSYPTVLQQVADFQASPETVDLVLVNGGINDIDFRTIINPFTHKDDLQDMIEQYCYRDMKTLLEQVLAKFTKPAAKIVVTSYFPILSIKSSLPLLPFMLAVHGVTVPPVFDLSGLNLLVKIAANCEQFWTQSSLMFMRAIDELNQQAGGPPRLRFAMPPFTDSNAALAPEAWLWGLDSNFSPEDPLQDQRKIDCNQFEPDLIRRQVCYRASTGHPNNLGARQFTQAILKALAD